MKKSSPNQPARDLKISQIQQYSQFLQLQQERTIYRNLSEQEMQQKRIDEGYKVATWNRGFKYYHIDTSQLHSIFVDENEDFKNCLQLIQEYNTEMEKAAQKQIEINNGPQRNQFFNLLSNLLMEVIFTKNRIIQNDFVAKVNAWAIEQSTSLNQGATNFKPFDYKTLQKSFLQTRPLSSITKVESTKHLSSTRPISAAFSSIPFSPQNQLADFTDNQSSKLIRPLSSQAFKRMRPITATTRPDSAALSFGKDRPDTATSSQDSLIKIKGKFASQDLDQGAQQQIEELSNVESETKYNIIEDLNEQSIQELPEELLQLPQKQLTKVLADQINIREEEKKLLQQKTKVNYEKYMKELSPYQQIQEIEKDYRLNHRTKHADCDPPAFKLKEYKTKKIGKTLEEEEKQKQQEEEQARKQNESVVTYPVPQLYLNQKQQQQLYQEQLLAQQPQPPAEENQPPEQQGEEQNQQGENGEQNENEGQNAPQPEFEYVIPEEEKKEMEKNKMIPLVKNYTEDENSKETFKRNLNEKFEQRGNYLFYAPSNDEKEMRMEQLYVRNRQDQVQKKRENEEFLQMKKEWTLAKSKLETEINKKINYQGDASQFRRCQHIQRNYSAKELNKIDRQVHSLLPIPTSQSKKLNIGAWAPQTQQPQQPTQQQGAAKSKEAHQQALTANSLANNAPDQVQGGSHVCEDDDEDLGIQIDEEEEEEDELNNFEGDYQTVPAPGMRPNRPQSYQIPKHTEFRDFTTSNISKNPRVANQKQTSKYETFFNLENEINRGKLSIARRIHSAAIGIKKPGSEKDQDVQQSVQPSLSIYSRPFQKAMARPFSAVFQKFTPKTYQDQQLEEIESVKQKLSENKISIPISTLMNALLVPDLGIKQTQLANLPPPGMSLMKNPFFAAKKKKKRGKKKKKKSGK